MNTPRHKRSLEQDTRELALLFDVIFMVAAHKTLLFSPHNVLKYEFPSLRLGLS